jgi:PAS domain S-box-containing protein
MSRHSPEHSKPGEMAALVRGKDWSKTPLGPADAWPPSLTLTVNLMLASGFPMAVRWGPQFVMIYNDGYRPILGDKHPRGLGVPFREAWPEVQPTLGPLHAAILAGESGAFFAEDLLLKIQRRGAEWENARFTVSYSPIPDDTAPTGIGGVLITAVETTDRVRTEESLRASEERFAGIFRQTSVGIVQCDLEGRFLMVNNRYCEITGRAEAELASLRVADITHPADRRKTAEHLQRLVLDGAPFVVEKRYLRPDGSQVWVTNNVALTRTIDGKPENFIAIVQDVTDSKGAQDALREREADLQLVLDSATDGVYCIDTEGVTTMCNAAFLRMLGFENLEDAVGRKLHDVIHHTHPDGSHYPKEECPIYRTAKGGGSAHVDHELFYRQDGSSFPVEYWVNPILRGETLQGAVCTFIDITERRRAQEQQSLLLRELNHRVKNLFAVTGGMISLSARTAKSSKELATSIRGRLSALALAHEIILPHGTDAVTADRSSRLDELVRKILSPYVDAEDGAQHDRFGMDGPAVAMGARAVTSFALILHELATNAAKYGALSVATGRIRIEWSELNGTLFLKWSEHGGPAIAGPPSIKGFGTVLSDHSVRGQFDGTLSYTWLEAGLVVELSLPVERLSH